MNSCIILVTLLLSFFLYVIVSFSNRSYTNDYNAHKNVMFWGKSLRWAQVKKHTGNYLFKSCPTPNLCRLYPTHPSYYDQMDAFIVISDLKFDNFFLPSERNKDSIWIYMNREPPPKLIMQDKNAQISFHLTMTYNAKSDIPIPWGILVNNTNISSTSNMKTSSTAINTKANSLAVWFVSDCQTQSKRELVVKALSKYVTIDILGACGIKDPCRHGEGHNFGSECMSKLLSKYKFYLAFENSLCEEYVTEKVYEILRNSHPVIPVVYGAVNYDDLLPPKSFLNVRDFGDMRLLGEHMRYLNTNLTAFQHYFEWRRAYHVVRPSYWCLLCARLHQDLDRNMQEVKYRNFSTWWHSHNRCQNVKIVGDNVIFLQRSLAN